MKKIFLLSLLAFSINSFSHPALNVKSESICFTPQMNCTNLIIAKISSAKESIYVQAYTFTSTPIEEALLKAKSRGVDVKVILDKSQLEAAKFFVNADVETYIDYKPAIAHNKIMIIDNSSVITGSFNFTFAAQLKNAENVVILNDGDVAKLYLDNWIYRQSQSTRATKYFWRYQ